MSLTLTVEAFDAPLDLMDELEEVASLEAAILDLETTMENIISIEGVSKRLIEPYKERLTNIGGLEAFTATPTKVNYDAAMVALEDNSNYLIGAIILAVGAILAKVVGWLLDLFLNRNAKVEKVEKAIDNSEVIGKATEKVIEKVSPETKDLVETKLKAIYENHQKQFDGVMNSFVSDVLNREGFFKILDKAINDFRVEISTIQTDLKTFNELTKNAMKLGKNGNSITDKEMDLLINKYIKLEEYESLPIIQHYFKPLGIPEGFDNVVEVMQAVEAKYQDALTQPASKKELTFYAKMLITGSWSKYNFKASEEIKDLRKIESTLKDMNKLTDSEFGAPSVQKMTKLALKTLQNRFIAIQKYFKLFEHAFAAQAKAVSIISKYINAEFNTVSSIVTNSKDEVAKTTLDSERRDVKSKVKKL